VIPFKLFDATSFYEKKRSNAPKIFDTFADSDLGIYLGPHHRRFSSIKINPGAVPDF